MSILGSLFGRKPAVPEGVDPELHNVVLQACAGMKGDNDKLVRVVAHYICTGENSEVLHGLRNHPGVALNTFFIANPYDADRDAAQPLLSLLRNEHFWHAGTMLRLGYVMATVTHVRNVMPQQVILSYDFYHFSDEDPSPALASSSAQAGVGASVCQATQERRTRYVRSVYQ